MLKFYYYYIYYLVIMFYKRPLYSIVDICKAIFEPLRLVAAALAIIYLFKGLAYLTVLFIDFASEVYLYLKDLASEVCLYLKNLYFYVVEVYQDFRFWGFVEYEKRKFLNSYYKFVAENLKLFELIGLLIKLLKKLCFNIVDFVLLIFFTWLRFWYDVFTNAPSWTYYNIYVPFMKVKIAEMFELVYIIIIFIIFMLIGLLVICLTVFNDLKEMIPQLVERISDFSLVKMYYLIIIGELDEYTLNTFLIILALLIFLALSVILVIHTLVYYLIKQIRKWQKKKKEKENKEK